MKTLKIGLAFCLVILCTAVFNAQNHSKKVLHDFEKISGSWKGSLTYLDYSSGKPYTMPSDLDVKRIGKTNKFEFSNIYPNETNANSTDTIVFSTDGKYIDKELIKSRRELSNGDVEIITEELGKDGNDNKPAMIKHTYIFGDKIFKKRKDIQFSGEDQWINRHEYSYTRKLKK